MSWNKQTIRMQFASRPEEWVCSASPSPPPLPLRGNQAFLTWCTDLPESALLGKEINAQQEKREVSKGTFLPFSRQAQYNGYKGNFETKGTAMLFSFCKANASCVYSKCNGNWWQLKAISIFIPWVYQELAVLAGHCGKWRDLKNY